MYVSSSPSPTWVGANAPRGPEKPKHIIERGGGPFQSKNHELLVEK